MKHIATIALMLNLGVAGVYAQEKPVKMMFSGTFEVSTINLKPDTNTLEENFAGNGTLGAFTFRSLITASPQPSDTCSGPSQVYITSVAGGGVFRFRGGSLLTVKLKEGAACLDFAARQGQGQGQFTVTYQITGGTGRFQNACGTLTLTYTALPVVADASNQPVFIAATGQITGTISGVAVEEGHHDEQ